MDFIIDWINGQSDIPLKYIYISALIILAIATVISIASAFKNRR